MFGYPSQVAIRWLAGHICSVVTGVERHATPNFSSCLPAK